MEMPDYARKLIRERRSIYTNLFSEETIPDSVIEDMIENARWAPTHRLTQPWRFTVFTGTGLQKLAQYQAEVYRERNPEYDEVKYEKLLKKPLECSHIIAIGMHRDPEGRVPEVEEVCAVACAVQNMWLTASSYRVGCYWSTGGITFYDGVGEFFGWKAEDQLLGFLYLGMPKIEKWPAGRRDEMSEKTVWINQ